MWSGEAAAANSSVHRCRAWLSEFGSGVPCIPPSSRLTASKVRPCSKLGGISFFLEHSANFLVLFFFLVPNVHATLCLGSEENVNELRFFFFFFF